MKLARIFAVCVLLFALTAPTTAAARWVDLGSDVPYAEPELTLLRSDMSGVTLGVDVPGVEAVDIATDLGLFSELRCWRELRETIAGSP